MAQGTLFDMMGDELDYMAFKTVSKQIPTLSIGTDDTFWITPDNAQEIIDLIRTHVLEQ